MKQWDNNKSQRNIIYCYIGTINSATLHSSTLNNVISNSKTLNQCNIKQGIIEKVQHLIGKYYNGTILNNATITIAITTTTTSTSAI